MRSAFLYLRQKQAREEEAVTEDIGSESESQDDEMSDEDNADEDTAADHGQNTAEQAGSREAEDASDDADTALDAAKNDAVTASAAETPAEGETLEEIRLITEETRLIRGCDSIKGAVVLSERKNLRLCGMPLNLYRFHLCCCRSPGMSVWAQKPQFTSKRITSCV